MFLTLKIKQFAALSLSNASLGMTAKVYTYLFACRQKMTSSVTSWKVISGSIKIVGRALAKSYILK